MSKILILGDLHIGCRNNNSYFMEYQRTFFTNLQNYIIKNNISTIIQLGDILDNRTNISFLTSKFLFDFLQWFDDNKKKLYIITGNHDTYYRNTLDTSGINQFKSMFNYVDVISKETVITDNNTDFILIPWICDENKQEIENFLENYSSPNKKIVCGHFELENFPISKNRMSDKGQIETKKLEKFDIVYSGHFHSPSESKNIIYVGTPYQITWNDYGDKKRMIIYDTENNLAREIFNSNKIFDKIIYEKSLLNTNLEKYKNKILKIIISDDINFDQNTYELFLQKLEIEAKPHSIKTIDIRENNLNIEETQNIELEDPMEIILSTIKNLNITDDSKEFIKNELFNIHKTASEMNEY